MNEGYQPKPSGIPNDQLKRPRGGSSVQPPESYAQFRERMMREAAVAAAAVPATVSREEIENAFLAAGVNPRPGHCPHCNAPHGAMHKDECIIPAAAKAAMLPVVTQAKYFHYVELDDQKEMIGFQTYAELRHHLARKGEDVADPLGSAAVHGLEWHLRHWAENGLDCQVHFDTHYGINKRTGWSVIVDGRVLSELVPTLDAALAEALEKSKAVAPHVVASAKPL